MSPAIQQAFDKWYPKHYLANDIAIRYALNIFEAGWTAAIAQPEVERSTPVGSTVSAEDIYAAYPRKVGKQGAIKAIQKAIRDVGADRLLNDVKTYAEATSRWPAEDRQYIPHPATWFNRGSYEDDPKEWERNTAPASQFSVSH